LDEGRTVRVPPAQMMIARYTGQAPETQADISFGTATIHQGEYMTVKVLFDALTGPKRLIEFGTAEGAGEHCESGATTPWGQRVFDWLDETLRQASTGTGSRPGAEVPLKIAGERGRDPGGGGPAGGS
jgi:hypothetical protein